jgi:hypothetical protein
VHTWWMTKRVSACGRAVSALGVALAAPACPAQWTAVSLHTAPLTESIAHAVTPSRAFGEVRDGTGYIRAAVWENGAWTSFMPPGRFNGRIFGVAGGQQVGQLDSMAAVWFGSAESAVILHTPGDFLSAALATSGLSQVGYRIHTLSEGRRATLWSGNAAGAVSLHPPGARLSEAQAAAGNLQGGYVSYPNVAAHATIWSGSVSSAIDLHPPGHGSSYILGMAEGQQVGYVGGGPLTAGAALWSGSAASFVSLHRPEFGISELLATCGTAQAGITGSGLTGVFAGVWFGTPESHISLHASLPAGQFAESYATSIAELDGVYYVGGYARRPGGGTEAILWVGVPSPGAAALLPPGRSNGKITAVRQRRCRRCRKSLRRLG